NHTTLAGFRVATWLCRPVRTGPRAETGLDSVFLSIPPKTGSRRVRESVPLASCFSHRSGLFLPALPKTYGFRGGGAHAKSNRGDGGGGDICRSDRSCA